MAVELHKRIVVKALAKLMAEVVTSNGLFDEIAEDVAGELFGDGARGGTGGILHNATCG